MPDVAHTTAVTISSDLGLVELSDKAGKATSWIRVARTGYWPHSSYGELRITADDIRQMHHNFKNVTPKAPMRVVVDYNHGTLKPRNPDEGVAAGFFADLEVRANGDELWGLVEWTEKAAKHIRDREYQGVSPTIIFNYTYKDKQQIGTTLVAAAITNHPFIEDLQDLHQLALSDADRQDVRPEIQQRTPNMKTVKVKDKSGADVEIDIESLPASAIDQHPTIIQLKAQLPKEDQRVVAAADFNKMNADVTALSTKFEEISVKLSEETTKRVDAEKALQAERADARVADLLRNGLIKNDDETKTFARKMALSEDFEAWKKTLVRVVPLSSVQGSESHEGINNTSAPEQFEAKVSAHFEEARKTNPKAKWSESLRIVSLSNRELAHEARVQGALPVGAGGVVVTL